MDLTNTREFRLSKYSKLGLEKKTEITCPVCYKSFVNRYSLANHFLIKGYQGGPRYLDKAHEDYNLKQREEKIHKHKEEVKNRIYKKSCIRCGRSHQVDFDHRFQKRCPECEIKYPVKNKKPTDKTKENFCTRCNARMIIKVGSNNQVCSNCRKKERDEEVKRLLSIPIRIPCLGCGSEIIYYKKHLRDRIGRNYCETCRNDPYLFKKKSKYNKVIELLEQTDLTRRDIKDLLGLESDFIREAAIEKFGKIWYDNRIKFIRDRAQAQTQFNRPSGLEKKFSNSLKMPFEPNTWKHITVFGKMRKCEIDIKVNVNNRKFSILIDGEFFHGKNSYFGADKFNSDIEVSKVLAGMGYYTIRYSETEVNNGWANKHFNEKYEMFLTNPPSYYYRNWMTQEEILR